MSAVLRTAALVALFASAIAAQTPPAGAPAADAPRTRVRGRVVDARTRAPLKGAKVVIGNRGEFTTSVETDSEGLIDIPDAPVGEQSIAVFKSAYANYAHPILVPAGRELEGVRIEMHRSAAITGRVRGADGSPLPGARVRLLQSRHREGTQLYSSDGVGALSDDRGIFRIWNLVPGDYVVAVESPTEPGPQGATVYRAMGAYYPNALSVADAARLRLDWGLVQEGIDFKLEPAASTRVNGVVDLSEIGRDCDACQTGLSRQEGGIWVEGREVAVGRNGAFSFVGLAPGHYALRVDIWSDDASSTKFGLAEFEAIEDQLTTVAVDLYGERPVSGRVVFVGPPAPVAGAEVKSSFVFDFQPTVRGPFSVTSSSQSLPYPSGAGSAEASFQLALVPGRYRLGIAGIPGDGYVRSVSIAGRPIEGPDIEVPPAGLEDVVIILAFDAGKIAGRVDQGKTAAVEAGLLPVHPVVRLIAQANPTPFDRDLSRMVNTDGSFEIGGLPPGHYRAFALAQQDAYRVEDPAIARKLAPWSKQVDVRAGQTVTVDLKAAPRLRELE